MKNFFDLIPKIDNLLIIDLNSVVLDFYYLDKISSLIDLDFNKIKKISEKKSKGLKNNLLGSVKELSSFLEEEIKLLDKENFRIIFLLSPNFSEEERKEIKLLGNKFSLFEPELVDRHYFYHQFLMQKKNFSKEKLLVSVFDDLLEMSFFADQSLISSRVEADFFPDQKSEKLEIISQKIKDFIFDLSLKNEFKLDYVYLFDRGTWDKDFIDALSKELRLELIPTESLS